MTTTSASESHADTAIPPNSYVPPEHSLSPEHSTRNKAIAYLLQNTGSLCRRAVQQVKDKLREDMRNAPKHIQDLLIKDLENLPELETLEATMDSLIISMNSIVARYQPYLPTNGNGYQKDPSYRHSNNGNGSNGSS